MKELWTKPSPAYHSERWSFADLKFAPKPYQQPHMPLWVGGASPGAMRRAALLGDGWHPNGVAAEDYRAASDEVRSMATAAGRDPSEITMSLRLNVTDAVLGAGSEKMIETLKAYEGAGVEHVVLAFESGDVPKLDETLRRIAAAVVPAFS